MIGHWPGFLWTEKPWSVLYYFHDHLISLFFQYITEDKQGRRPVPNVNTPTFTMCIPHYGTQGRVGNWWHDSGPSSGAMNQASQDNGMDGVPNQNNTADNNLISSHLEFRLLFPGIARMFWANDYMQFTITGVNTGVEFAWAFECQIYSVLSNPKNSLKSPFLTPKTFLDILIYHSFLHERSNGVRPYILRKMYGLTLVSSPQIHRPIMVGHEWIRL